MLIFLFFLIIDPNTGVVNPLYLGEMKNQDICAGIAKDLNDYAKEKGDPNRFFCSDTKVPK